MAIRKLDALLLELASGLKLLVPQVEVAEVVEGPSAEARATDDALATGFLAWRGLRVPVIDPGTLCGLAAEPSAAPSRHAILFALERLPGLDYYALPLQGTPRAVKASREDLPSVPADAALAACPLLAAWTKIEGVTAAIPHLAHLEQAIVDGARPAAGNVMQ